MAIRRGIVVNDIAVEFIDVVKNYPLYHHITSGFKNLVFNLPKVIREMKAKKYQALSGISFQVKRGEVVGIIGRNGAGKSTTLGLIAQVLKPSSGKVIVNGRVSPLLELGGGFHPDLSGIENIRLNGVLMGLSRKQVEERLNQIIEFSELGDFINEPIRTYSSGMMSRLGFSVVAHLNPEILLIDEVLAVGDVKFQQKCIQKMFEFKKNGVTMIMVSHSESEVKKICDRLIWIDNHKVKMIGPTNEVISEYAKVMGVVSENII